MNAKGFPITPPRQPPAFPLTFTTPIGGAMRYTYGPEWVTFAPGWIATTATYVELQGTTAWGDRLTLPFHVTSSDWQESDQWLTAMMTAFGSPARPVPVGWRRALRRHDDRRVPPSARRGPLRRRADARLGCRVGRRGGRPGC